jgi:hypothetical protein
MRELSSRLRSPVVEAKTVKHTLNLFHYKPSQIYYILHSTINYYLQLTGALTKALFSYLYRYIVGSGIRNEI